MTLYCLRLTGILPFLVTVLLCLWIRTPVLSQETVPDLAVFREKETDATPILKQIQHTGQDTARVNIANKLARIYWFQRHFADSKLDSCFEWANAAYTLSSKLKDTAGHNEASFLLVKVYIARGQTGLARQMADRMYGEQKVKLLLLMGEHYTFDFEANSPEFLKALPLIKEASAICKNVGSDRWQQQCRVLEAKMHFKSGNVSGGRDAFMKIIQHYHKLKDYASEARYWSGFGNTIPENDSTYEEIIRYHENAVHYYSLANRLEDMAYSLRDLGTVNANHNKKDTAEKQLLQVITILKSINKPISSTTYRILGDFYRFNGEYDKALQYTFESLKAQDITEPKKASTHVVLGTIYQLLKDTTNSLKHYRQAFDFAEKTKDPLLFMIADNIASTMSENGSPEKALNFLNDFKQKHPVILYNDKQLFAASYGQIYNLLGDYKTAETYFQEMLSLNKLVSQENGRNLNTHNTTLSNGGSFFIIGKFYAERGRFKEAKKYLEASLANAHYMELSQEAITYSLLFKTDSALGDYVSAIKYYQRYNSINDSVNSVVKNRQINELNIRYQTEQQLNSIASLKQNEIIQKSALQKTRTERNIIIAGALTLLILIGIVYSGYKGKQKSNKLLELQKEEINSQNEALQVLLNNQEILLKEKEWLVREIHHRVKNNLQIVMGLLGTQAARLQNEDAITAITKSENRVKSIALIHQKLYTETNLASINMPEYVFDLIHHLEGVFNTREKNISFRQNITQVFVDISQAVSIGLILNEAITNAIKYAFSENGGIIQVSFEQDREYAIVSVKDDGKGFTVDKVDQSNSSIGMEMMHGLARQLKGSLEVSTEAGTRIVVRFRLSPASKM